jgi:hypothetical protein
MFTLLRFIILELPMDFFNVEAIESTTKLAHPSKCRQVNLTY